MTPTPLPQRPLSFLGLSWQGNQQTASRGFLAQTTRDERVDSVAEIQ